MHAILCLTLSLTASMSIASGQDIRVLTLDTSRTVLCQSLDFDIVQGNAFTDLRSWLANPAFFGSGGTVPRSVMFVPQTPLFDAQALVNADVVLLTTLTQPLLRCEVDDLIEFVRQGGGVFSFSNTSTLDFNSAIGATGGDPGGPAPATVVDPASPVISGPFGTVPGSIGTLQFHRIFSSVGPNGNAILSTTDPVMAEFSIGAGRLLTIGDEEWVMNGAVSGCAAGQLPNAERQTLFLNGFASVTPLAGFQYVADPRSLGVRYCTPANLNSSGLPATICASGSDVAADNDVTLAVDWISSNAFGYFLVSRNQGFAAFPGGSQGNICLGSPVGRYIGPGQIQNSGTGGFFTLQVDLTSVPQPTGFVAVMPGDTWNFQAWYRDANPQSTSNFTDGLSVTFL